MMDRRLVRSKKVVRRDVRFRLASASPSGRTATFCAKARSHCAAWTEETFRNDRTRRFRPAAGPAALGILCTLLPLTAITGLAGVPLVAYGAKRAKEANDHDSNAVGMIGAGSALIGAGLAGIAACPLSKHLDRRSKKTIVKKKRGEPRKRIVVRTSYLCDESPIEKGALHAHLALGPILLIPGSAPRRPKPDRKQTVTAPLSTNGCARIDLLLLIARAWSLRAPDTIDLVARKDEKEVGGAGRENNDVYPMTLSSELQRKLDTQLKIEKASLPLKATGKRQLRARVGGEKNPDLWRVLISCPTRRSLSLSLEAGGAQKIIFRGKAHSKPEEPPSGRAFRCSPAHPVGVEVLAPVHGSLEARVELSWEPLAPRGSSGSGKQ
jgi:hypothetical protein